MLPIESLRAGLSKESCMPTLDSMIQTCMCMVQLSSSLPRTFFYPAYDA